MNTRPPDAALEININIEIEEKSKDKEFLDLIDCRWDYYKCCLACLYIYQAHTVYKCVPDHGGIYK